MLHAHFPERFGYQLVFIDRNTPEPEGLREAQFDFLRHIIDNNRMPRELHDKVIGTWIRIGVLRNACRYAQDQAAAVNFEVIEQDITCDKLNCRGVYGDERFETYRYIIENQFDPVTCPFPRGQHIGDEAWLHTAEAPALIKEAMTCVDERYYMEGVLANMVGYIERFHVMQWRKTLGKDHTYVRPVKKDKNEKALVKYTGGRGGRGGRTGMGRGGRGGRGGGNVGRAEGATFRGWK